MYVNICVFPRKKMLSLHTIIYQFSIYIYFCFYFVCIPVLFICVTKMNPFLMNIQTWKIIFLIFLANFKIIFSCVQTQRAMDTMIPGEIYNYCVIIKPGRIMQKCCVKSSQKIEIKSQTYSIFCQIVWPNSKSMVQKCFIRE